MACGPDPYTVADAPGTTPHALIGPGGVCTTLHGRPLSQDMVLSVRTWGNAAGGTTAVLVGTYLLDGEISRRLLDALPPLLTVPADTRTRPLLDLLLIAWTVASLAARTGVSRAGPARRRTTSTCRIGNEICRTVLLRRV